jgi:glycosyltransferase involved in cell wall biosynthesis
VNAIHRARDTVLFVSSVGNLGGSVQSLLTVLRHVGADLRPVLATPDRFPLAQIVDAEHLVEAKVTIPSLLTTRRQSAGARSTAQLVRWTVTQRTRVVALHANGLTDAVLSTPAAVLAKRPLVVWVHDADVAAGRTRRFATMLRHLGRRVRWAAVSAATAEDLERLGYAHPGHVCVIPNPIDPATTLARRKTIPGPIRIGFLGAPSVRKGIDLLPAVARGLDPETARLLVFARPYPGAPAAVYRPWEELVRMGQHRVELLGRCDDIRDALELCDVVLCPSRVESFCRVAAEAMLNGLPVMATDMPAIREVVGDDAGLLARSGDSQGFIDGLRRLIADPDLRRRLGAAGQRRAQAYAPSTVARALETLYRVDPGSV